MRFDLTIIDMIEARGQGGAGAGHAPDANLALVKKAFLDLHEATIDQALDSERIQAEAFHMAWNSKLKRW
jgi:hypothetical protein